MPHDYTKQAPNHVRRRDRAVSDDAWIRRYLHGAPYGAVATVHEGRPFIHSNLFVFDEGSSAIYFHTARVGRTAGNVLDAGGHAPVCFSAFGMGRLLPAETALGFSVEYEGVTAFGSVDVLKDADEARAALQLLLDKYAPHLRPGRDYRPITDDELARTRVYRIAIDSWSGKRKEVEEDFPGAFAYAAQGHPPENTMRR